MFDSEEKEVGPNDDKTSVQDYRGKALAQLYTLLCNGIASGIHN